MRLTAGLSLLKRDDLYSQVTDPSAEDVEAAQAAYLGGHIYYVSNAEAASLAIAGYADWLSRVGYGIGPYGQGSYGEDHNGTPTDH